MNILLLDIETAPSKAFIWGLWQEVQNTSFIEKDWYILSWAAKWLGDKEMYSSALPDFKEYKSDRENDKPLLTKLIPLLDKADIVIAHNGINFDRKKINARLIMNGFKPPAPYRMIDTLDVCRKEFAFTSNKLGDVAKFLGVGEKVDTGGFQLWKDCLNGIMSAWATMVKYNKKDILLLEKVYLALRPYILLHPNLALQSSTPCCPKCGSDKIHYRGYKYTNLGKYKQFVCLNPACGGWGRLRVNELDKKVLTAN